MPHTCGVFSVYLSSGLHMMHICNFKSIPICQYIKLYLSMQHSALLQQFTQYVLARVLEQTDSLGYTYCDKMSWEETKGIHAHRMHKHMPSSEKIRDISDLWILFISSVVSA